MDVQRLYAVLRLDIENLKLKCYINMYTEFGDPGKSLNISIMFIFFHTRVFPQTLAFH